MESRLLLRSWPSRGSGKREHRDEAAESATPASSNTAKFGGAIKEQRDGKNRQSAQVSQVGGAANSEASGRTATVNQSVCEGGLPKCETKGKGNESDAGASEN
jgi:hypothetical protein